MIMDFDKKFDELSKMLFEISNIESSSKQMKAYFKLSDFLKDIWEDGYNAGIKRGRTQKFNITKN